jgi:hypothetical protein
LSLQDITLPEVLSFQQSAKFFKSDKGQDLVEIAYVGSKDTTVQKVKPEHMAKFRDAWNNYCDGTPMKKREGTQLTALNGVTPELAEKFIQQNVHTVEELAVLNDMQCQALGHGTLTFRKQAQERLAMRDFEARELGRKKVGEAAASIGPVPAETYASKSEVAELSNKMDAILAALAAKPKPGRPKKTEAPSE